MKYNILLMLMLAGGFFLSSCRESDPEKPEVEEPKDNPPQEEEEVPLDFLRIRVTTNKGYDRTVELHSLPEKMQVSNTLPGSITGKR